MFFFFKQKTAYEMRISDWSSDVCSSDLRLWRMNSTSSRPMQRAGETARPGTDLDDRALREAGCRARNAAGQVEVEQEVLAQRLAGAEAVAGDDQIGRASCRASVCQYV